MVEWGTLEESPPPDQNQDIIFVLDIDEPFLYTLQEESFAELKSYILKAQNHQIIWVTHSSQQHCNDPRYGLTLGFSRTLRRELGIDISVFETDSFDAKAASFLCLVYDKIKNSRAMKNTDPEYEFSYYEGAVHVGRCHWGLNLDDTEANSSELTERDIRKLEIGSTGLLDTMHWTSCPEESLKKDQVEIDMRKISVNFRVNGILA